MSHSQATPPPIVWLCGLGTRLPWYKLVSQSDVLINDDRLGLSKQQNKSIVTMKCFFVTQA